MSQSHPIVVNRDDVEEEEDLSGQHLGGACRVLTPAMRERGGKLGVNLNRLPPGRTLCPFHSHDKEDEVFYVLSGHGVLRYGEELFPLREGDCVSCPAGTGVAHQIANTSGEDLLYLAIGNFEADEICHYPDSGKVMVRKLRFVGRVEPTPYLEGEPELPKVFELAEGKRS